MHISFSRDIRVIREIAKWKKKAIMRHKIDLSAGYTRFDNQNNKMCPFVQIYYDFQ